MAIRKGNSTLKHIEIRTSPGTDVNGALLIWNNAETWYQGVFSCSAEEAAVQLAQEYPGVRIYDYTPGGRGKWLNR